MLFFVFRSFKFIYNSKPKKEHATFLLIRSYNCKFILFRGLRGEPGQRGFDGETGEASASIKYLKAVKGDPGRVGRKGIYHLIKWKM